MKNKSGEPQLLPGLPTRTNLALQSNQVVSLEPIFPT